MRTCLSHDDRNGLYKIYDAPATQEFFCSMRKKWIPVCGRHAGGFKRMKNGPQVRKLEATQATNKQG